MCEFVEASVFFSSVHVHVYITHIFRNCSGMTFQASVRLHRHCLCMLILRRRAKAEQERKERRTRANVKPRQRHSSSKSF